VDGLRVDQEWSFTHWSRFDDVTEQNVE